MMRFSEVYVLDRNAEHLGVPQRELMENAGKAVANALLDNFDLKDKSVLILCGIGNNGGDGFVAARYLKGHCTVRVALARPREEIRSELALENLKKAVSNGIDVAEADPGLDGELRSANVIVDALLGVGARKDSKSPYAALIKKVNRLRRPVVSVDVPSGLGTQTAIRPTITVTFHDVKEGMGPDNCGRIIVADIGIPVEAGLYVGPGEFVYYPVPRDDSHKGDNGRVLVVGGGPYSGAPSLAALAAYRVGADLVRLAVPRGCHQIVASYSPNFIVHPLEGDRISGEHVEQVLKLAKGVDAILVGPGAGDNPETLKALAGLIASCAVPMVIDADALKSVAGNPRMLRGKSGILTPHKGEFELLSHKRLPKDLEGQRKRAVEFSKRYGFVVLLKGRIDVISEGQSTKMNRTGNPGMTVGGTGDVLAGLCAGLLAKGMNPFNAARLAAFISGSAGDLAFQKRSYGLLATDVIEEVPAVLKSYIR